ncbi:MAG: hypothetical protein ACRD29_08390 [Acidimicrobiales bacterium]
MSASQAARYKLYEAARSSWGDDVAETLMNMFPPVEWANVATKADLEHVRAMLSADVDGLRSDMAGMATKVELYQIRADMNERFADQTRTLVFTILASNATLVTLAFAAARFGAS